MSPNVLEQKTQKKLEIFLKNVDIIHKLFFEVKILVVSTHGGKHVHRKCHFIPKNRLQLIVQIQECVLVPMELPEDVRKVLEYRSF